MDAVSDKFNLALAAIPVEFANKSILVLKLAVSRANLLLNIADVSDKFNFALVATPVEFVNKSILELKLTVSRPIR
jgi:hypothetical protein